MPSKRARSPAEAPGSPRPVKRAARTRAATGPATPPPRRANSAANRDPGAPGNPQGTPNAGPKTSRAERAERRSRVQELEEQVKTLREKIARLLDQQAMTRRLEEQLRQTTKERREMEEQVKALEEAMPQQSDGGPPRVRRLRERLSRAEEKREALEPQLQLLKEALRQQPVERSEVVQLQEQARLMRETSTQLDKSLEGLEKPQPRDPEQSQIRAILVASREGQVDEFEQKLGELKEVVKQRIKQQLMVVAEAVSQQPELLLTDNTSEHRRKMSQVAARPVRHAPPFSAGGVVVGGWAALDLAVSTLAEFHFPQPLSWDSLSPMLQERFLRLTPKAKLYLEDDFMGMSLFEAWIWHTLDERVFSKRKGPWMGEHWAAYSQLQNLAAHLALPQDAEWTVRYHIWRNLTVAMVQHITGDAGRVSVVSVVQGLKDELGPVLQMNEGRAQQNLDERLDNIAKYAAEVDVCMQFDRTDWAVIWRHPDGAEYGFPFDETEKKDGFRMAASERVHPGVAEWRRTLNGRPVELVTVPLLRQRGMEGGFAYHLTSATRPMQVVVDQFPDDEGAGDAAGVSDAVGLSAGDHVGVAKAEKCSKGTEQS